MNRRTCLVPSYRLLLMPDVTGCGVNPQLPGDKQEGSQWEKENGNGCVLHSQPCENPHQGQGYDLYDGHTSPPFIAPAATQGGADGSVFSTGTACGMPEGTLWPFCSLIRRSR